MKGYSLRRHAYMHWKITGMKDTHLFERLFSLSVPTLVVLGDLDGCRRHADTHPSRLAKEPR